ncbi:MAG TPA: PfkB family carbohydrate kinase [Gaiellaceae bacterium]|jgi:sugar/nucleoside kinase (ribokinase family)
MALTVVGSVAFDSIATPFGKRERVLGGAAVHFSLAASFFTDIRLVGVVGGDFGADERAVLEARGIDLRDLEVVPDGETFFWRGHYDFDLNTAKTLETRLNVFADFQPKLSDASRSSEALFLANIQPDLQRQVREQCRDASFVALDSMNYWIDNERDSLIEAIKLVDALLLNDAEVRQITGEPNLVRASRLIREWGPSLVVVKQGEYGAALFSEQGLFSLPAYPLEDVVDPTGAGDTFAGGFVGFLAAHASGELTEELLRAAVVYGSTLASFNVEEFGTERVARLTLPEIERRFAEFRQMTQFEQVGLPPFSD